MMIEAIRQMRGSAKYWIAMTLVYVIKTVVLVAIGIGGDGGRGTIWTVCIVVFCLMMLVSVFITVAKPKTGREEKR